MNNIEREKMTSALFMEEARHLAGSRDKLPILKVSVSVWSSLRQNNTIDFSAHTIMGDKRMPRYAGFGVHIDLSLPEDKWEVV